ncbi:hypothetical protein BDU57DRAFT_196272 [Ampelomyces quisqualis]|uniref:Uncharacterized protein n=1 Tax=Ampelomyces quisqualis TaxID=50730 RepID=A0A6A5QU19_AMPQU|nr:hypothetical protein BDU57DRAFT_196272 [Ampelomyces quisqualis]
MGNGTEVRSPDSSIIPDDGMKAASRMPSTRQVSGVEKTLYKPFANQDSDTSPIARSCMPNTRQVTAQTDTTKNTATRSFRQSPASQPAAVEIKDRSVEVYVRRVASQGALESTRAREQLHHIMDALYNLTEELRDVRRILRLSQRRLYKEVGLTRSLSPYLSQIGDEGDFKVQKVQTSVQSGDLAGCHDVPVKESENLSGKAVSIRQYVSKTSSLRIRQYVSKTSSFPIQQFVSKASELRAYYDLQRRDRVARIIHIANKSAFEVYGLHIALRLQLGRVILFGKKQDRSPKVTIKRLEACLITLRAFGEVLYSGTTLSSAARVRKKLTGIELQTPIQRFLVRSIDPGAQLRGRTSRYAADARTLRVHYRRNRTSRKTVSRPVHLRFAMRRAIRYHTSAPRTLPPRPVQKLRANWQRREARSWRRVRSLAKKESNSRLGLVQTVSSWLGGSPVTTKAAAPVAARRRRRTPYGSRAFGSGELE